MLVKCIGRYASRGSSSRMESKWVVQRLLDCSDPKCLFPPQWQVRVVGLSMTLPGVCKHIGSLRGR